jgi:RNA polymerase sigma factor (sigma-70 family)
MANVKLRSAVRHLRRLVAQPRDRDRTDGELLRAFVSSNDQPSFAQVVKRHGPMVLSVCRRVLHQEQDAEDAFQATFLLLARKASAIRKQESLGSWLHGVAYHMATDARKAAARRRRRETEATSSRQASDPARAAAWREVQAILDEEVARLPAVYREPFVLCCLEGRSCAEAAERLGHKEGTVWSRVARARQRLQQRLARRGVCLTTALGAAAVAGNTALSAVPPALLGGTIEAAARLATDPGLLGALVSPRVAALLKAGARATLLGRVKALTPLLLIVGLAAGLGFAAARPGAPEPPAADPPAERKADATEARTDRHGDPLPVEAIARLGTVRFRHAERITSLAFTPDGKRVISHGYDGIRAWDAATGRETCSVAAPADGWIDGIMLTRDGKSIVSTEGTPNHFLCRVRSSTDLTILHEVVLNHPSLYFRASPDGKFLAQLHDGETTIELWDVASGKQIRSWNGHDRRVWALQFSADGKTLVTCGEDKAVRFWDVATGKQERAITGYPDIVGVVALSPDGSRLATVGMTEVQPGVGSWPRANRVRLWDVAAGKEVTQLAVPPKDRYYVADVAFTDDGKSLVTSGPDDKIHFWDPVSGKEQRRLDLGDLPGVVALSPKGDAVAVAVGDKTVRLLDVAGGKESGPAGGHQRGLLALTVTPDGRTVATADGHGAIRLWDPATGRERRRLEAERGAGWALRLLGDGSSLLSRDADGTLRLWDLTTGRERRLQVPLAGRLFFDVSPDGKALAGAVADGDRQYALAVVELATGRVSCKMRGPWPCGSAFTPDGRGLVAWYYDHTARVWDVPAGREVRQFRLDPPSSERATGSEPFESYPAALSPDGRLLAHANGSSQPRGSSQAPHFLTLRELATGKAVRPLDRLPDRPAALAFSPDGHTLAWGGAQDRTVHLVEVATGKERHVFRGHKGAFTALAFSADGRLLVSGNEDTTALVWDLAGRRGAAPGQEGLAAAWADLTGDDAARAYDAVRRLAATPGEVVPFLRGHLRPVPVADEKHIARLVADLDSDEFAVREKASGELERLGDPAVPACRKALEGKPSAEMRQRLEKLLEREDRGRWSPTGERLRQLRALEALELTGGDEALRRLEELAGGMPGAWLTEEAKAAGRRLSKR